MTDFAMPYIIQTMREFSEKINRLTEAEEKRTQAQQSLGTLGPVGTVVPGAIDPHTAALMTVAAATQGPMVANPMLTNVGVQMLPPGGFVGAAPPGLVAPGYGMPQPPFGM